jgi:hypothetical protein
MKKPTLPRGWKPPFWVNNKNGIGIWVQDSSNVLNKTKGACLEVGDLRECEIVCYALNQVYSVNKK